MAAMEWYPHQQERESMQMMEKSPGLLSFLGRRSLIPRPLSDATDFFDLENSEDDTDSSSPLSLVSLDDDSQTTASSREEVTTPHSAGLGGFEFHFDHKPIEGPVGPHLFRHSSLSDEYTLTLSPLGIRPKSPIDDFTAELIVDTSDVLSEKPVLSLDTAQHATSRPFTSLNTAVAELDETQVRDWSPRQVAEWMAEAGFDQNVVEKFLIHDISGTVLLDLQFEDLKELDISSFGKRHRVMSTIQHLRNSSMISPDTPIRTPSRSPRSPRVLQRSVRPEEVHIIAESKPRRGRQNHSAGFDIVTPAESVSIVAIEQLLPKPHKCSKGEDCPRWQKQQRKLLRIQQEFAEEASQPVEAAPSVIGSSDVLGPTPAPLAITAERLSEVQPRDAQENVRQFLSFQIQSNGGPHCPSPPPAPSASFVPRPTHHLSENLRGLPKLTIPQEEKDDDSSLRSPISALRNPTNIQSQLKAQLQNDPYHYGGVASPVDVFRIGSPFSAMDIPVTAMAIDPCARDVSQSVPPDMRYGAAPALPANIDFIPRSTSTQPYRRTRQPSFFPSVAPVRESTAECQPSHPPVVTTESSDLLNHTGWMKKRKTTRLLRHEWEENFYALDGSRLMMLDSEHVPTAHCLDEIDVDAYAVHAYSVAGSSKLSAALKKSILGKDREGYAGGSQPSFAFSLVPDADDAINRGRKSLDKKSHHFAVKSGNERVEWMRRIMLAKAAAKGDDYTF